MWIVYLVPRSETMLHDDNGESCDEFHLILSCCSRRDRLEVDRSYLLPKRWLESVSVDWWMLIGPAASSLFIRKLSIHSLIHARENVIQNDELEEDVKNKWTSYFWYASSCSRIINENKKINFAQPRAEFSDEFHDSNEPKRRDGAFLVTEPRIRPRYCSFYSFSASKSTQSQMTRRSLGFSTDCSVFT